MKLIHFAIISIFITVIAFPVILFTIKDKNTDKTEILNTLSLDLSKPIKKSILENKISEIIKDSFKLEFDEETNEQIYIESSNFYFEDVRVIQDTIKQKVVVNFKLFKPYFDGSNEVVVFVMITFLRKEIDIVTWSYSQHFVDSSEYLFETEKNNSSYIKQK